MIKKNRKSKKIEYKTLPFDYARCCGTAHPTCKDCMRRQAGDTLYQSHISPQVNETTGKCECLIQKTKNLKQKVPKQKRML